jgi:hypothetical protein
MNLFFHFLRLYHNEKNDVIKIIYELKLPRGELLHKFGG